MSWDAYVDSLTGNNIITKATIIGHNGAVWTPAGTNAKIMPIEASEAATLGATMKEGNVSKFSENGIVIGGVKYMFLRELTADVTTAVAGKKAGVGNVVVMSTNQAVVIGFIPEEKGDAARSATGFVENIAKYLMSSGY